MKRRNTYRRRSKTHRRRNNRISRRRTAQRTLRGGFFAYRPPAYATSSYWVAGEEEAPRIMTVEEIERKRTEDDKGI